MESEAKEVNGLKGWAILVRYSLGVLCTAWILFELVYIRLYGSFIAIEPNLVILNLEIVGFAIILALQLVPLKEKRVRNA